MLLASLMIVPQVSGQTKRMRNREVREAINLSEQGMQLEAAGDYDRAIALLNDSRELMASPMMLYHLGICYARMGQLREARDFLTWALADSPDFLEARQELLRVEELLGDMGQAPPEDEEQVAPPIVMERPPTTEELQAILFPVGERLTDAAAWAKSDDSPIVVATYGWHYQQGQLFFSNQRYPRAAAELVEALRLDEGQLEARLLLAEALALSGQRNTGVRQLAVARERFPDRPEPLFKSGEFLRQFLEDHEGAVAFYQQCIERFPDFAPAYTNLGNAWYGKGDYSKALEAYQAGVVNTPDNPKLYRNIGVIYQMHLGDKEQARQAYLKYLELGGEDRTTVERYLQELDRVQVPDRV